MDKTKQALRRQNGNVLFIILLGVILFASLSYTVMRSQGNSSDTGSVEKAKIQAAEILRYAANMRQTIDRMRNNGTSENDLSFAHPDLDAAYGTFGTDPKNEVFHPSGGGMNYLEPKEQWLDESYNASSLYQFWLITGRMHVEGIGPSCADSSCTELILIMPYVKKEICQAINALLNIGEVTDEPPRDSATHSFVFFSGSFTYSVHTVDLDNSDYDGLRTVCWRAGSSASNPDAYHFSYVLIER